MWLNTNDHRKRRTLLANPGFDESYSHLRLVRIGIEKKTPLRNSNSFRSEIEELALPGFQRVFSNKHPPKNRAFWALLCIFILGCCIYQCVERIQFFFDGPSSVYTEYVRNKTIMFPAVTVCPSNSYAICPAVWPSLLRKASNYYNIVYTTSYDLMQKTKINVTTLWKISQIPMTNLTYSLSLGVSLNEGLIFGKGELIRTTLSTTCGTCITITPTKEVKHNHMFRRMKIKIVTSNQTEDKGMTWKFLVHSKEDTQLCQYMMGFEGVQSRFGTISYSVHRIEQAEWLNTWQKPCVDANTYTSCIMKCLQKLILQTVDKPCRLPYMTEDIKLIPQCNTAQEFKAAFSATNDVIDQLDDSKCACRRKCKDVSYTWEFLNERSGESEHSLQLEVIIPDNRIQLIKEQKIYSTVALFSDIGGGIGLFLGVCIFHLLEIAEIVFARLFRFCKLR